MMSLIKEITKTLVIDVKLHKFISLDVNNITGIVQIENLGLNHTWRYLP